MVCFRRTLEGVSFRYGGFLTYVIFEPSLESASSWVIVGGFTTEAGSELHRYRIQKATRQRGKNGVCMATMAPRTPSMSSRKAQLERCRMMMRYAHASFSEPQARDRMTDRMASHGGHLPLSATQAYLTSSPFDMALIRLQ